ncbi:MAG: PfkB family carbohydrate kinase [Chloroflexota bacterium]|nr:MAG: bifunctional heptose 7-phosphate kinase/heptose 1-phosphate adenyltransferase [Chloroflexota bacterium]
MMTAIDVVQGFRDVRVLLLGDAMLDTYLEGSAERLCREGPVPVVRRTSEGHAPGGAANTAVNLRALGAEVYFLSVAGEDSAGSLLRRSLREHGVDDRWVLEEPTIATLHKLRVLADDQYVVRFDSGDVFEISVSMKETMLDSLTELYPRCDVVVISDYCYGSIFPGVLRRLGDLRRSRPRPLVVDSKNLRNFHGLNATIVAPNLLEARLVTEAPDPHPHCANIVDAERTAHCLLELVDAEHVAITMAGKGVLLASRGGKTCRLPTHPVARANDVGAGDSFTAAVALALATGADPAMAVRVGIGAGSIAVTRPRTAIVQQQELLQRVSLDDGAEPPVARDVAWRVRQEQRSGRTVVFTNGVFDILHAGHVHFLRQAKCLGDVLIVGVNTDRSARTLKGKNRPINSERDRLALVRALDSVDDAILFDEETPSAVILTLRPDVHVKGGDYAGESLPEADAVRAVGGRLEILPLVGGVSTTGVIDRILALALEGTAGGIE